MTTPGLPQITPARLPDQEVWESAARESLLRHLPVRASLIGLVGAGLTSFGASPAAATLTGPDSNGLCTATDETSVVAAMENTACESVTVPGPITLDDGLNVVKPLTLQGPTNLSGFYPLTLSETTTSGGSVGSLHIEDTVTIDRSTYIQVMSSAVTISGTGTSSSRIVSTNQLPYVAQLIKVCSAYGQPCEPGSGDPATISDIAISDITLDGAEERPALLVNAANMSIDNVHVVNGAARGFSTRSGGIAARNSQIQITDSHFENNTKWMGGGAIRTWNSALTISTTSFVNNEAENGAALYVEDGVVQISSSLFESNTASRDGGAIHLDDDASLSILNTTLSGNLAGRRGGAIYLDGSDLSLSHSTVAMNEAEAGAGIFASHNYTQSYRLFVDQDDEPILDENGYWQYDVTDVAVYETATVAMSHTLLLGNVTPSGSTDDLRQFVIGTPDPDPATPPHTPVPVQTVWTHSLVSSAPNVLGGTFTQVRTVESATVFGSNPVLALNAVSDRPTPRTKTLALVDAADNPAIDAGAFTVSGEGVPQVDQRGSGYPRVVNGRIDIGAFESAQLASSGNASSATSPVAPPVDPLLPSVMPVLSLSGSTFQCALGEFTEAPTQVDATLIVGGVRQEMRRIAMPATTVTWELDPRWRGQSVSCEVVAIEGKRVATVLAAPVAVPAAVTPSPTPTTPAPTTPSEPARGFAAASIRFAPLSSALDAADRSAIASLVEQAGTDATFRVTGYVQAVGSTRNDRVLSRARAQAVAAELRRLGVAASNITAIGGGRSQRDGAAARRATITARWTR